MKRILFYLICIFPQLLLAQTLTSGHSLRAGDELRRSVVYVPDCPYEGEDAVWNLEDMVFLDNSLTSSFCGLESAPGMVTCYERFSCQRYILDDGGISLSERHTATSHMAYGIPEIMMRFPMHAGDCISGIYGGNGTYGDKLFVREYGSYKTKAAATGSIILPDGDTLHHVCMLSTERLVFVEAAPADSMRMAYGDSIPEYSHDSICSHMLVRTPVNRVREQRWYAAGYRYPILETTEYTAAAGGRLLSKVALYYPPEAQESQLPYDGENEQARLLAEGGKCHHSGDCGKSGGGKGDAADPVSSFHLSQNHEAKTVTITYDLDSSASLRAVLASTMGVVYRSAEQAHEAGTGYSLTLSYSGLPHGQYVVSVSAGGLTHTAKFNAGIQ